MSLKLIDLICVIKLWKFFAPISAAGCESKPKLLIKAAATTSRQVVTSPSDVTSTSEDASTELGVQLTVGRRLKHIAMKATFDQPQKDCSSHQGSPSAEFYPASELLGSFIVDRQPPPHPTSATVVQASDRHQLNSLVSFLVR